MAKDLTPKEQEIFEHVVAYGANSAKVRFIIDDKQISMDRLQRIYERGGGDGKMPLVTAEGLYPDDRTLNEGLLESIHRALTKRDETIDSMALECERLMAENEKMKAEIKGMWGIIKEREEKSLRRLILLLRKDGA